MIIEFPIRLTFYRGRSGFKLFCKSIFRYLEYFLNVFLFLCKKRKSTKLFEYVLLIEFLCNIQIGAYSKYKLKVFLTCLSII